MKLQHGAKCTIVDRIMAALIRYKVHANRCNSNPLCMVKAWRRCCDEVSVNPRVWEVSHELSVDARHEALLDRPQAYKRPWSSGCQKSSQPGKALRRMSETSELSRSLDGQECRCWLMPTEILYSRLVECSEWSPTSRGF